MLYKDQAQAESCLHCTVFWMFFFPLFPSVENRHFGETNMNDRSSRSHTIFRVVSYLVPVTQALTPEAKRKESRERGNVRARSSSEIRWYMYMCPLAPRFPAAFFPFALPFATWGKSGAGPLSILCRRQSAWICSAFSHPQQATLPFLLLV